MKNLATVLFAGLLALAMTGCAGTKTVSQRGWIGGDYALSKPDKFWVRMSNSPGIYGDLPKSVQAVQTSAIQITGMSTNVPAYRAGLRRGDFVLEVNHRKVASLESFRRAVDRSKPGGLLTVKAYRDGRFAEYQVPVGCEKYRTGGCLTFVVPTVVHRWDLWPNPGFSLVCVGYEPNPGLRHNLGNNLKAHGEVYDENWSAYIGFIEFSCGKRVVAQETVAKED